ncbi:MAG TPA: Crp/Fnr family transcriptional regulator [Bacillota bacterium]|jgi:CRP-like cAMP-binding protein|nr:Crp/Fnr family transcriptional regulator [Bacillota bacterium]
MMGCLEPKICEYTKDECIAIAGDDFDSVGVLLKGKAAIVKETLKGDRVIVAVLQQGDMFGEMAVFSSNPVWPSTVIAEEDCTVFFLSGDKIMGQCEKVCPWHKTLIINMLKIVSERALALNKKIEYLTIKSMRGRISSFLLDQYRRTGKTDFELSMSRNDMADYLNVSRPSMCREMSRMKDEGIIDYHRSKIKIIDIYALQRSVE